MGITLKESPSGKILLGENDGDVLIWQAATNSWVAGSSTGGGLPDGNFAGQALYWDGAAWLPVPTGLGPVLRVDGFTSVDDSPSAINIGVGSVAISGVSAQLNDSLSQAFVVATTDRFQASYDDTVAPRVAVVGSANGLELQAGAIGFFTALPVPVQSITGATTQNQVDSIIAALVAFGLVTDDR